VFAFLYIISIISVLLLFLLILQELEGSLQSESGKLYAVKCDITKEEDIKEAFKWVKDNLGGVDILVNNAAGEKGNTLCGNSGYYIRLHSFHCASRP
jgi:enoyl-[acyl-carrier-protein] reductase (NADH)